MHEQDNMNRDKFLVILEATLPQKLNGLPTAPLFWSHFRKWLSRTALIGLLTTMAELHFKLSAEIGYQICEPDFELLKIEMHRPGPAPGYMGE